jgi:hypothetical protein
MSFSPPLKSKKSILLMRNALTDSHGVSFPLASFPNGSPRLPSLPHPIRSAFRLSQPHSGLLLPMATGFVSHRIRFWNLCPSECFPQEEPDILSASMPSWCYTPITHRRPRKVPYRPEPFYIPASTTQPKSGCLNGGELLRSRVDET